MKKTHLLIAGSAISLALFAAVPSYAQEASTAPAPPAAGSAEQEPEVESIVSSAEVAEEAPGAIVVTGSRIRRDTFSTIEPITVGSGLIN